jgi:hypothetical protein
LKFTVGLVRYSAHIQDWVVSIELLAEAVGDVRRTAQGRRCIINLNEVTFIDKSGERMLLTKSNESARFVANDVYVKHGA